ncbi:hypothetical protein KC19_5G154800 [Ceratodon purpureus]|uniref:Uncharacterized protein n=1 Tax=Ceratodon purpureus TaxID=3225 RepID=A0A8T0I2T0_CERPU|nr:hypothetical protein KC19_5G154800 [Ceratodon purpureus]
MFSMAPFSTDALVAICNQNMKPYKLRTHQGTVHSHVGVSCDH